MNTGFSSITQQLGLVLSDTAVFLHSLKFPNISSKIPPKPSFQLATAAHSAIAAFPLELPECLQNIDAHTLNQAMITAARLLQTHPELAEAIRSKDIIQIIPVMQSTIQHLHLSSSSIFQKASSSGVPFIASQTSSLRNLTREVFPKSINRTYATGTTGRFINGRRLAKLESDANNQPGDPRQQAEFYRELMKIGNPAAVVSRFEKGRFSADEECWQIYVAALAASGQAERIMPKVLQRLEASGITTTGQKSIPLTEKTEDASLLEKNINPTARSGVIQALLGSSSKTVTVDEASTANGAGLKGNPIHVIVEESRGYIFWRALRWLGITFTYAFCILTFLSLALENSGLLKTAGGQTEYEPASQQIVRFSDVQGVDEAKQELEEIVEFLRDPSKFTMLGGKLPKGVLLTGPPGTGKTLLARAVAGEAGVPFFFMSGSEFDEMYVGVGARRVRELFAAARRKAPSIVFIDELDAIGGKRNPKDQTYMKQTLNQLLVDLDGFSQTEGVIFIAATNFPELLDKALVRPGRFDRHVAVPLPDVRGRVQILHHHMKNILLAKEVDVSIIARGTPGFSGADLANLVNQAAIQASREASPVVTIKHLEHAKDKILMGAERRSAVITPESKRMTAYHEGGHALVAYYTPGAIPLHKATIMPRGRSLGMTVQLPEMDKDSYSRKEFQAMIDVCMGGRVAEELVFGKENVTSGAHNDIMKATDVAKKMVMEYGMSDKLGPIYVEEDDMSKMSPQTRSIIENEVKLFVEAAEERSKQILTKHKDELHRLAKALIDYETLNQDEIKDAIAGRPIRR